MPIDQNQTTKFWLPAAEILLGAADLAVLTLVGHWLNLNLATASLAYLILIVLLSLRAALFLRSFLLSRVSACRSTLPRTSRRSDSASTSNAHLILNAVKATSGSSKTAWELLIRTELDGPGGVLVAVEDSGPD